MMKYASSIVVTLLLCLGALTHVQAQTAANASISVEHPWARATPAGARTGAAYVTLANHGKTSDRLIRASTPVADKIQFHREIEDNGIMKMRELRAVDIGPGDSFSFKPSGAHIMLIGLKQPLKEGQALPLTLVFEKAGPIEVQFPIAKAGATEADSMSGMHH